MPKIFCPSCRSHYVGIKVPKEGDNAAVMFCHHCRETWRDIETRNATTIGMVTNIMKDTFN